MARPLKWPGRLRLLPAPFLLPLALFVMAAPEKENPRIAAETTDARIESPRLFGGLPAGTQPRWRSASLAFPEFSAQALTSDAEPAHDVTKGMALPARLGPHGPRGACGVSPSDLCFDMADGRIVYRPARQYMPKFDGLTAESLTVRRDGLRFRYSFR